MYWSQEVTDFDSAKKENQVVVYESENPLCGKESPDLNPLYPEDSIENNSSYANFESRVTETGSPAKSEEPISPSKSNEVEESVDIAQTDDENSNNEPVAQDTVVNLPLDECCDSDVREVDVEEVETQTPIMSISAQVMERDNSEGYVTAFETDDTERRNNIETEEESSSNPKEEEKVDSTAVQCNGCVTEDDVDETCVEETQPNKTDENCSTEEANDEEQTVDPEEREKSHSEIVSELQNSESSKIETSEIILFPVAERDDSVNTVSETANHNADISENVDCVAAESEIESPSSPVVEESDCGLFN